jgi:hypothetical protein
MKTRSIALVILLLSLLTAISVAPVYAQDATAEATVEANRIDIVGTSVPSNTTVEDGGLVINVEAPETPAETPAPVDNSPWGIILAILVVGVGVIVTLSYGFQAAGNRANAANNDPITVAMLERAYDSVPPTAVTTLVQPFQAALERTTAALEKMTALVQEITDKTPKASKPTTPYPPATGTPLDKDNTLPKTDTLPNRPADGGAPGVAGTGFPPVR